MPKPRALYLVVGALADIVILAGCSGENRYIPPPPPKVTVALPMQQAIRRYLEVTGNMGAVNTADLVARVPGYIQEINYEDGALVKKGTLLFTLEPEPYEVRLRQAEAAAAGAQATVKQTRAEFDRQASLVPRQAATQQQYDQALANRAAVQSILLQAQANSRLAAFTSDYAHVKAPFDGVVTARQVSVGAFVGGTTTPTLLATIVQMDRIYVNFNISEQDVLRLRAEMTRRG
jgi:RND family efflux transporter MFP subunit